MVFFTKADVFEDQSSVEDGVGSLGHGGAWTNLWLMRSIVKAVSPMFHAQQI
jgi:hypothetical protein